VTDMHAGGLFRQLGRRAGEGMGPLGRVILLVVKPKLMRRERRAEEERNVGGGWC
jgi:hypothetical protein